MLLAPLLLGLAHPVPDEWTAHPLPEVCHADPTPDGPRELLALDHLPFPGRVAPDPRAEAPPVPASFVLQLADEALRARDQRARLDLQGDMLLVQGEEAARATVAAVLGQLEDLERRLRIELRAPRTLGEGAPRRWVVRPRAGERVALGERRVTSYLGGHDVNVASDSGVAEPEMHRALTGETLHLTAARLADGRVLVEGTLDLAELTALQEFDPDTPDLGIFQLPEIACAQVRFAGLDSARVELTGLPTAAGSALLEVTVAPAPDVADATGPWRVFPLDAISRRPPELEPVEAGALGVGPVAPPEALAFHDPGGLAARIGEGARGEGAPLWVSHLLFVPAGGATEARTDELLSLLEGALVESRLTVSQDELTATFPIVAGRAARLGVGREQRRPTGLASQLAPSTWMPVVEVERTFDGIVLHGLARGTRFRGTLRETRGEELEALDAARTGLAAVQRLERGRRASAVELDAAGGERELLPASPHHPGVRARLRRD